MAKKVKAATKKVEKVKDIEDEIVDIENEEEILEDVEFDLDVDDVNELEASLEPISMEERIIRVEKSTKLLVVLQIIGLVLLIVTMVFSIAGGGNSSSKTKTTDDTQTSEEDYTYSTEAFTEIGMDDISSISKKKEVVIFMGRQGCYWCSLYAPVIGMAADENNFDVYYLDFGKMVDFTLDTPAISDEESYDALIEWLENSDYADSVSSGIGTPMTFFVKNGKLVNMIGGYVDESGLETYLKEEGFIK